MVILHKSTFDIKLSSTKAHHINDAEWQELVQVLEQYCAKYNYVISNLDLIMEKYNEN